MESVACFLHENPLVDRARIWRKVISNVRGGAGIDSSIFYEQENQVAFEAWVEEHGSVPRSYSRIRRLQYRVSVGRFSDQRARAGWCSSCIYSLHTCHQHLRLCAVSYCVVYTYRPQGFAPTSGQESSSEEDLCGEGGGGGGDDGNSDHVSDGGESGSYERSASDGTGSSPSDRRGPTLRTPNTNPCRLVSLTLSVVLSHFGFIDVSMPLFLMRLIMTSPRPFSHSFANCGSARVFLLIMSCSNCWTPSCQ